MKEKKIQWHPGFVAAMNLEFAKERERQEPMPVFTNPTGQRWMRLKRMM